MSLEKSKFIRSLDTLSGTSRAITLAKLDDEPWARSIDFDNLEATLVEIEKDYHPESASLLKKLWWIRCQLSLGLVPSSALTAPLEEVFGDVQSAESMQALALATYLQAALKLLRKNQIRLACMMMSRAYQLKSSCAELTVEESGALNGFYLEVLNQERNEAELRRENSEYILHLDNEIEKCQKESFPADNFSKKTTETPGKLQRLSSKHIIENIQESSTNDFSLTNEKVENNSKRRSKVLSVLALMTIFSTVLAFAWIRIYKTEVPEKLAAAEPAAPGVSSPTPEQTPPVKLAQNEPVLVARTEPKETPSTKKMNALDERIHNLGSVKTDEPGIDQNALSEAGKIKLPGEDDELVSIERERANENIPKSNIPKAHIPNLDRRKIKPVEVGSSGRKAPLMNPNPPENQANIQAKMPLRDSDPVVNRNGEKALDGSPLRSYEVKTYNPPVTFKTITPTNVLVAPSLFAQSLTRLEVDTHVHVTRRMGNWLELRSTGGSTGYIFAQDATQLSLNAN